LALNHPVNEEFNKLKKLFIINHFFVELEETRVGFEEVERVETQHIESACKIQQRFPKSS
jgi:hypothetical protein